jgi:hypothetical protein
MSRSSLAGPVILRVPIPIQVRGRGTPFSVTSFAPLTQILTVAGEKLKIPSTTLSDDDKTALEEEVANFKYEDEDAKTKYVPVLLDDKVAHDHYDGYCKQSEISVINY